MTANILPEKLRSLGTLSRTKAFKLMKRAKCSLWLLNCHRIVVKRLNYVQLQSKFELKRSNIN